MTAVLGNAVLTFELWCDYTGLPPAYRIYVDEQLMTERDYICKNPQYHIRETVPVHLAEGIHYLHIENLCPDRSSLEVRSFKINGADKELRPGSGKFVVDTKDFK